MVSKRREDTLTPEEHRELLVLIAETERLDAKRIECLAELAQQRGGTLGALMDDLGIQTPPYA